MSLILSKLSALSKISEYEILGIAENSHRLYRTFSIKKRNGGGRVISEPSPTLKHLQRCVNLLVIQQYPVSNACAAYERHCSVYGNAKRHIDAKHVLKLDIKGFFHSIVYGHFYNLLKSDYPEDDIKLLWNICSYFDCLPMGAPTSPFIANRVMFEADIELHNYFKKTAQAGISLWKILWGKYDKKIYTRYSDDITISSKEFIAKETADEVAKILSYHGFLVNKEKTRFCGPGDRKRITGVIVQDGNMTLGLKFRRDLKKQIYNCLTKQQGSVERIRGLIAYAESIEPDFVHDLRFKYNDLGYKEVFC